MAEPGNTTVTWAERMELLKDSAQQRLLNAPMPTAAMEQLLAEKRLSRSDGSRTARCTTWTGGGGQTNSAGWHSTKTHPLN